MKEGGSDRIGVELEPGQDDAYLQGVDNVGLATEALLAFMGGIREEIGFLDDCQVNVGVAVFYHFQQRPDVPASDF